MDIENLNKSQIVLLTLLVSFVTSIATGIVTVTLLDQAPPAITQNVNRIVERTVERVVPAENQEAAVVTTEKTVVVKENDLITESIDTNAKSLVRILQKGAGENGDDLVVGLGVFVSQGGMVATDSAIIFDGSEYVVTTSSGNTFDTVIQDSGSEKSTALLRVVVGETGETAFSPVTFSPDLGVLKLGQQIVALSGSSRTNVAIGIIASLDMHQKEEGELEVMVVNQIQTDIGQERLLFGSPLIDIFGEVIGIHTSASQGIDEAAGFTPISELVPQVAQFIEQAE